MLFNSIDFAIFLPTVFILYWFVVRFNLKAQNSLLLLVSYVFYGWWDWRFLSLIVFSSIVDYLVGLKLVKQSSKHRKRILLLISILVNIGFLMYFKYFNFFVDSFVDAFKMFGVEFSARRLNVILPVGISFYTFQTLSYSIDVYRGKLRPTKDFVAFFAYVSFFPQLVAGPIERAVKLLPQFYVPRKFDLDSATLGMRQILWGLFKKVVIADNCAPHVDFIFENYQTLSTGSIILGTVLFAFQIYGDFSGYSDIAIGTAKLFGFRLMTNFRYPYFSRDIAEFWRRWHISLSTWFRDYVYIPLGGSRVSHINAVRNTLIVFVVSGFWHGANWTFIIWGFLNALYFLPLLLTKKNRKFTNEISEGRMFPSMGDGLRILKTFLLTCIAWVFFRANSFEHAIDYIRHMILNVDLSLVNDEAFNPFITDLWTSIILLYIVFMVVVEWRNRTKDFGLAFDMTNPHTFLSKSYRWLTYIVLMIIVVVEMPNKALSFIYFQF